MKYKVIALILIACMPSMINTSESKKQAEALQEAFGKYQKSFAGFLTVYDKQSEDTKKAFQQSLQIVGGKEQEKTPEGFLKTLDSEIAAIPKITTIEERAAKIKELMGKLPSLIKAQEEEQSPGYQNNIKTLVGGMRKLQEIINSDAKYKDLLDDEDLQDFSNEIKKYTNK